MADTIAVLTGAGISAESGIHTFRGQDGLWENYPIEDVATYDGFLRNPQLVQRFYNERRRQLLSDTIAPNAAHHALAGLEDAWPGEVVLITQNIDNLHERAGSRSVIHMHGELLRVRCMATGITYHWKKDITPADACPCCNKTKTLRPHIVWFGEIPLEMDRVYDILSRCSVFVSIGTSGTVYPAAGFVQEALYNGNNPLTVELNLEPSLGESLFTEKRYGPATVIVPDFVKWLLDEYGRNTSRTI